MAPRQCAARPGQLGRPQTAVPRHGPRDVTARAQHVRTAGAVTSRTVAVPGAQLELLSARPAGNSSADAPPIILLHGAAHGAWCWAEHFLPWLAEQGCECHALSWRGHVRSRGVLQLGWRVALAAPWCEHTVSACRAQAAAPRAARRAMPPEHSGATPLTSKRSSRKWLQGRHFS